MEDKEIGFVKKHVMQGKVARWRIRQLRKGSVSGPCRELQPVMRKHIGHASIGRADIFDFQKNIE